LKEPQTKEVVKLQLEKKVLGPAFKRDAKLVEELLVKMQEKELLQMDEKLKSEGKYELKSGEKIFEITPKMVQVEKVQETVHVVEYVPNVIEPSFGLGRILYCLLEHSFYLREGSETRNVLQFPPVIAPIKVLIVPIIVNPDFDALMKQVSKKLRASGVSLRTDTSGNKIGKKYSRMDELGTPFAITVDFESLKDNCVTLRERDSTKQIRADVDTVVKLVKEMCEGMKRWEEVEKQYPTFVKESDE
jgi:glycyl-tRNA synthetase